VLATPRLRDPRRRQSRGARRLATSPRLDLRSGGGGNHQRRRHPSPLRKGRSAVESMLSRELLKKIRKLEISTSRLVNDRLAGHYQSVFKGRGMAFSEVRPYFAGDDVRTIDWNVSARMNEAHVKLFVEERDRTVMLLVDMS